MWLSLIMPFAFEGQCSRWRLVDIGMIPKRRVYGQVLRSCFTVNDFLSTSHDGLMVAGDAYGQLWGFDPSFNAGDDQDKASYRVRALKHPNPKYPYYSIHAIIQTPCGKIVVGGDDNQIKSFEIIGSFHPPDSTPRFLFHKKYNNAIDKDYYDGFAPGVVVLANHKRYPHHFFSGDINGNLCCWFIDSPKPDHQVKIPGVISHIEFSPYDHKLLVSSGWHLNVYEIHTNAFNKNLNLKLVSSLQGLQSSPSAICWLDRNRVAASCSDGDLIIWRISDGFPGCIERRIKTYNGFTSMVNLGDDSILTGALSGHVVKWNLQTGDNVPFRFSKSDSVWALTKHPTKSLVAVSDYSTSAYLLNTDSMELVCHYPDVHDEHIVKLKFIGDLLYSSGEDGNICLLDDCGYLV